MKKRQTVERGFGYHIYYYEGTYFVDTYRCFAQGFATLQGAREHAYYMGYRESKED